MSCISTLKARYQTKKKKCYEPEKRKNFFIFILINCLHIALLQHILSEIHKISFFFVFSLWHLKNLSVFLALHIPLPSTLCLRKNYSNLELHKLPMFTWISLFPKIKYNIK